MIVSKSDKKKIIKEIKIFGTKYKISEINFLEKEKGTAINYGETWVCHEKININKVAKGFDHKLATLLHEIFEVINEKLELELEHSNITRFETAVFAVLKENPEFVKLFLK